MIPNINPTVFVALGIATTSIAQIILKIGSSFDILSKKWLIYLLISVTTYSISFLCYYLALRYFDISKISPIMMVSTVSVVALYGFLAGESINMLRIIGILIAMFSLFLILKS